MIRIFRSTLNHRNISLGDTEPNVLVTRTTDPHCFAKLNWLPCVLLYRTLYWMYCILNAEAEFLDEIQTKEFYFLLLQSALQFCLEISFSSNSRNLLQFYSSVTVLEEKGGKPYRNPYPLPYGLRNLYRNLKSENSQDYYQKPQQNCTFMNSASGELAVAVCTLHHLTIRNYIFLTIPPAYNWSINHLEIKSIVNGA